MAVQPLQKTKIIKKVKKHANRFHSDRYFRVGVSVKPFLQSPVPQQLAIFMLTCLPWFFKTNARFSSFRNPGELNVVLTPLSDVDTEVESEVQRSEESKTPKPDISLQVDSKSSWSETKKTWNCSSWTTAPTLQKSHKEFLPERGKC